jgi:hypothetical protein
VVVVVVVLLLLLFCLEACTHGIWIGTSALTTTRSDGKEVVVLLMDCEGIDSAKGDAQHDAAVFVLSILLSEVLIFNCVGVPSSVDFQKLQLFSRLSESLSLRRGEAIDDKVLQLRDHFPHLMVSYRRWLVCVWLRCGVFFPPLLFPRYVVVVSRFDFDDSS